MAISTIKDTTFGKQYFYLRSEGVVCNKVGNERKDGARCFFWKEDFFLKILFIYS